MTIKRIIIDTNALMAIADFKINLFEEIERICDFPYKTYVLDGTIVELKKIREEQRQKFKEQARLALAIIKAMKIPILLSTGKVDDQLVGHSKNDLVLTQDKELKRRLHKPYLTIRQKKKIVFIR